MADFTESEILNAIAGIFRAQLSPSKSGGTLDTDTEYSQLQEMVSLAFLLHPQSIYYLARLVANRLENKTAQEVVYIEDILVSLRDLGQIGKPFTNTTLLSDANTALLSLDAAASVTNRPEVGRFNQIMDRMAGDIRNNVVSADGRLVRPREEARGVIKADLEKLKELHEDVLEAVFLLRDLIDTYLRLDIPSKVAASAFYNIRTNLANLNETLASATSSENIALSREILLGTRASKAAVNLVAEFTDPSNVKYHGPHNPTPSTINHAGQSGVCTPASVLTSSAPWDIPILEPLVISVDGGAPQVVDLSILTGPRVATANSDEFEVSSKLHVTVDPNRKEYLTGTSFGTTSIKITAPVKGLSFKDLGAPLSARLNLVHDGVSWVGHEPSDLNHRAIQDLVRLQSFQDFTGYFNPTYVFGGVTYHNVVEFVDPIMAGAEPATGFAQKHVGDYIRIYFFPTVEQRFEILEVLSPTVAVIDPRGQTPADPASPTIDLVGSSDLTTYNIEIAPAFTSTIPDSTKVDIGPVIKTAEFSAGTKSVADLISDIEGEAGVSAPNDIGSQLNWHARALEVNGKLVLVPRSRLNPFLSITYQALRAKDPGPAEWDGDSSHVNLGFSLGQCLDTKYDTAAVLPSTDIADLIGHDLDNVTVEVVPDVIGEGTTLRTVAGTTTVRDTTVGFSATGAEQGDQIEIEGGVAAGTYRISAVLSTELDLDKAEPFPGNEDSISYKILKDRIKISSNSTDKTTSIGVVSAPATLGLTAGIYYGTSIEFQASNGKGELLDFSLAEVGDVLKLPGRDPIEVTAVDGDTLTLAEEIPSNTLSSPFVIRTQTGEQYDVMHEKLVTFTGSRNLLRKNGFDENLDAIDYALTAAIIPGQNFASSRNNARNLLNDLASLLTSAYERVDEHGTSLQPNAYNLTDILSEFSTSRVEALDKVIKMLRERRYDRAVDLLLSGDLEGFYDTDSESGSYEGAVMSAARVVMRDLPDPSSSDESIDEAVEVSTSYAELTDADYDYTDSEDEYEIDDG